MVTAPALYITLLYIYITLLRSDQKKTKVKKKTSDPQFEETFYFEVLEGICTDFHGP